MKNRIFLIFALCLLFCSCEKDRDKEYDRVFILYSIRRNTLNWDLMEDINDMCDVQNGAYVPYYNSHQAMVVIGHFKVPEAPFLLNIYRDRNGDVIRDTTFYEDSKAKLTDPQVMRKILLQVQEKFPSHHYGMILSSHGSGWIPAGKYNTPTRKELAVRSFGQEVETTGSTEMDITMLPHGIPFRLDYMMFDACLMGNIESIYELKGLADHIGASATEELTDGFDYLKIGNRLLSASPSPLDVCKDYIARYKARTGDSCSACICLVQTSELGNLASLCRELFAKYREKIDTVNPDKVQRFFRPDGNSDHNWFFDMEDIARQAGMDSNDLEKLSKAIGRCVIYKDNTKAFMPGDKGFTFEYFCGLGMYLQNCGLKEFDSFYMGLQWNKDTGYVK